MTESRCRISDLEPWECAHCRGETGLPIEPEPRRYQQATTGTRIWPLLPTPPVATKPPPDEPATDDPVAAVSRNLRAIGTMAAALGERALDLADHPEIPGGDAMVNLAHIGSHEAWTYQVDTDERLTLAGVRHIAYTSAADEDPDTAWSPFQTLAYWSEQWRAELEKVIDHPTLATEARFLSMPDVLAHASNHAQEFDAFAADVRTARNRLENIVRDGIRETRSRIMCDRCKEPKRLIRKWGKHGKPDRWKAPCCKAEFTDDEAKRAHARQLRSAGAERWVERTEAIGALEVQGWSQGVVRQWLVDVEACCEIEHRRVLVWWPSLWHRHLVATQAKVEREHRRMQRRMARDYCEAHHGPDCWERGRCTNARKNAKGVIQ